MNKKTQIIAFTFLALLTYTALAERNDCCQNKSKFHNKICSNGEASWLWLNKTCSDNGWEMYQEEDYSLVSDDELLIYDYYFIEKERYCLGSLENETEIAVICNDSVPDRYSSIILAIEICDWISIACLSLTTIVYILLPKLRDLQGKCIMTTVINLLFSIVVNLFVSSFAQPRDTDKSCAINAATMYFWNISPFFWINVVAFDIWRTTVRPKYLSKSKYIFTFYNIYGWGTPFILLMIALISQRIPEWKHYCGWYQNISHIIFFEAPIWILLAMNFVMFISVGWKICRYQKNNLSAEQSTNNRIHKSRKYKYILGLKLFLIIGINWTFKHIINLLYKGGYYIWYIRLVEDYTITLKGLIIFLVLVVFRKRVRRDLARRGGIICGKLPKYWALIPDEEIDELEDEMDEEVNEYNMQLIQPF